MAVMTYRDALNEALAEEMERDDSVFLMGEEVAPRRDFIISNAMNVENLDL